MELITVTDCGTDSKGNYLLLDEEIRHDYRSSGNSRVSRTLRRLLKSKSTSAVVGVSDGQAYIEIETSKHELASMGFNIRHFTYPYNRYSQRNRQTVSRCYDSARVDSYKESNLQIDDRYTLRSTNFECNKITDEKLIAYLQKLKIQKKFCMLHTHTRSREFSVKRLEKIMAFCLSNRIDITTRSKYILKM